MDDYPIWDESDRVRLNTKILDHYNWKEIGFETAALWRAAFNAELHKVMPKYVKMYLALKAVEFSVIDGFKRVEDGTSHDGAVGSDMLDSIGEAHDVQSGDTKNEQNSTQNNEHDGRNISSDTPQSQLLIGNIDDNLYASNASVDKTADEYVGETISKIDSTTKADSNSIRNDTRKSTNDTDHIHHTETSGYNQNPLEQLENLRKQMFDVEELILNDRDLLSCFLGVY